MTTLTTSRLIISPMALEDTELLFSLDSDPLVMKYINGGRAPTLEEIETVFVPRFAAYRNIEKGWGLWKVFIKRDAMPAQDINEFAGWILIRPMNFFTDTPKYNDLEIGWRFKQSTWGKGIATESAIKVIEHLIDRQPEIEYFSAIADERNHASINIMKKLAMSYQGKIDHPDAGDDVEVVLYSKAV
ncbi:GNAT family N-acetyltransferase [Shewanella fidelis]|uniref:GNAT family N-acetyltransferase n=1 Tax=Shewanella fidelis TaxID=173509 RepID=A0AAW8NMK7_9GAMM|nr:GNAT family N-acetyltransferase [Shewanella fidelis]MDR8523746.1 GNAT family N-acetyltransferase [Shewanella fidelis]MDW4810294.1 GNAT family N-acetyltransferase [Shewanella fidelis]MDW4814439.1 GNAT family N-acetyltransferase [Shewanella fidelis]MDW4818529.1 GNAT family N-acetyltransferase [Shewanella fidelis]MDW4823818.1 GNAT family N-acetyltransferase [Shewanella fidelis]